MIDINKAWIGQTNSCSTIVKISHQAISSIYTFQNLANSKANIYADLESEQINFVLLGEHEGPHTLRTIFQCLGLIMSSFMNFRSSPFSYATASFL